VPNTQAAQSGMKDEQNRCPIVSPEFFWRWLVGSHLFRQCHTTCKEAAAQRHACLLHYLGACPTMSHELLRYYLGLVSVLAIGNSLGAIFKKNFSHNVFNAQPKEGSYLSNKTASSLMYLACMFTHADGSPCAATYLAGRAFGTWTMMSGIVRLATVVDFYNQT
jgi:hypothetical protein